MKLLAFSMAILLTASSVVAKEVTSRKASDEEVEMEKRMSTIGAIKKTNTGVG